MLSNSSNKRALSMSPKLEVIKRGTEKVEMMEDKRGQIYVMKSQDSLLAFRDHAQFFPWWNYFFFKKLFWKC